MLLQKFSGVHSKAEAHLDKCWRLSSGSERMSSPRCGGVGFGTLGGAAVTVWITVFEDCVT